MKRYRIKNRFRFITFVTVVVLLISMALGNLFPVVASDSDQISYTEVKVQAGDTLWDLARAYGSENKDVRELIYDICQINDIEAGSIYPGQILLIPN